MKKIVSLFLISLLVFSMFSCKREADTDDTAVNIIENETPLGSTEQVTDKQNTEGNEDVTETAPEEQPLEDTPETTPDTETKTEQPEPETDNESETQEEAVVDTYLSPDVKLPEGFSDPLKNFDSLKCYDDHVLVMLTLEESAKQKESYSPEDFPAIDISSIDIVFKYYPEINNNVVIKVHLQQHGKESIIKAINSLFLDDKVYYAESNHIMELITVD